MKYLLPLLLILAACGKDTKYVHKVTGFQEQIRTESHIVKAGSNQVDVIWVIDNSGSMSDIQNDVITNTNRFMEEFTRLNVLKWRMGLLSTSEYQDPLLGFGPIFDQTDRYPVATFQAAVSKLGIGGSGIEKSFKPVLDKLKKYPAFLRPLAHLVVIFVTDEKEQSNMTAKAFLDALIASKNGRAELVHAYGAFHGKDFGCSPEAGSDQVVYAGSPFEAVITATGGKAYSTCAPNFGVQLAALGTDIASAIASPVILLERKPLPATLRVTYQGRELPPGPQEEGGFWFYDTRANGVRFHTMEFVEYNQTNLDITYEVDEGQ